MNMDRKMSEETYKCSSMPQGRCKLPRGWFFTEEVKRLMLLVNGVEYK